MLRPKAAREAKGHGTPNDDNDTEHLEQQDSDEDLLIDGAFATLKTSFEDGSQYLSEDPLALVQAAHSKVLRSTAQCRGADDTTIIGFDPDEVNTITAAKIGPMDPNSRHIIKRASLECKIPALRRVALTEYFDYMMSTSETETSTSTFSLSEIHGLGYGRRLLCKREVPRPT
ncbi:hypothetical protein BGZ65_006397, partial [Modicella reniformis]